MTRPIRSRSTAAQVVMSYKPQKPDGSLGNAINAGWDLQTNTKA